MATAARQSAGTGPGPGGVGAGPGPGPGAGPGPGLGLGETGIGPLGSNRPVLNVGESFVLEILRATFANATHTKSLSHMVYEQQENIYVSNL